MAKGYKYFHTAITKFTSFGECEIDAEFIKSQWNHLWQVHQWNDEYRLVKFVRKDSSMVHIKCSISPKEAATLIEQLDLQPHKPLASATTWKQ
jgi:hypothetical protein